MQESTTGYQLSGKTGSSFVGTEYVEWFVGYQESNGNVYFFATNITGPTPEANGPKAREISLEILQELTSPIQSGSGNPPTEE